MLTSKERVAMTIAHEEADRVPICATYTPEVEEVLREDYPNEENIGVALGNDMVKIQAGLENSFYYRNEEYYYCPWGIKWHNVKNETGSYSEISEHPLAGDLNKVIDYTIPNPIDEKNFRSCKEAIQKYGKEKWIIGSSQCSIFEASWYLRGLEQFMMDMILEPEYAGALMDKVMQFPLKAGLRYIDLGVDMIWLGDDIATQQGMMMSPNMWRQYLKPRLAHIFSEFKKANKNIVIAYHSCGNLQAVIDDLVEIGLDVLNPIQPLAMNPVDIKKRYGKALTLYGTLDVQKKLPFGTSLEVEEEVKYLIKHCAPGGGFILSPAHHIQSDTPIENIRAFYKAAKEFGVYKK